MPCNQYQEALVEAAASGGALSAALRSHVDDCDACRAALVEERAIFAAIENGVKRVANAEPPASFLTRVQASLKTEAAPRRYATPAWALACLTVVALLMVAIPRSFWRHAKNRATEEAATIVTAPIEIPTDPPALRPSSTPFEKGSKRARLVEQKPSVAQPHELYVLVPPGEEELLRQFCAATRIAAHGELTVVNEELSSQPTPIAIEPLHVDELKTESLEEPSQVSK
jgi:hypothetical protein